MHSVLCILILQLLKFWKIKFETVEPHFLKYIKNSAKKYPLSLQILVSSPLKFILTKNYKFGYTYANKVGNFSNSYTIQVRTISGDLCIFTMLLYGTPYSCPTMINSLSQNTFASEEKDTKFCIDGNILMKVIASDQCNSPTHSRSCTYSNWKHPWKNYPVSIIRTICKVIWCH